MPFKLTVCGLSGALSVIESDPIIEPAFVGLKVTLIVQLFPGLTVDPQLFVCVNEPVAAIFVMLRIPRPVFESMTV